MTASHHTFSGTCHYNVAIRIAALPILSLVSITATTDHASLECSAYTSFRSCLASLYGAQTADLGVSALFCHNQ